MRLHQAVAETYETFYGKIRSIQVEARTHGFTGVPRWPAIILRTPKGWTGPKEVDGLPIEGTFRAHQVPVEDVKTNPAHLKILEEWMHSYKPEELFDEQGRFLPELAALAPHGDRRMGAIPMPKGENCWNERDCPALTRLQLEAHSRAQPTRGRPVVSASRRHAFL